MDLPLPKLPPKRVRQDVRHPLPADITQFGRLPKLVRVDTAVRIDRENPLTC
jgi:hypothetical protein